MLISGNHDSGYRLAFASSLLEKDNIFIGGVPSERIYSKTLTDEFGPVTFWLLPYVFPSRVKDLLHGEYHSYDEAIKALLEVQDIDFTQRNVIVCHQNVTAFGNEAERGGSETMVGGVGGVDYATFDGFDYVALGHIHRGQKVGRDQVRYCGSPMCYHFNETVQGEKGPLIVELGEKGTDPVITMRKIEPLHPMREISGTVAEILEHAANDYRRGEYLRAVLKDYSPDGTSEDQIRAAFAVKGSIVMDFDFEREKYGDAQAPDQQTLEEMSAEDLFLKFWEERTGSEADEPTRELLSQIAELAIHACDDEVTPTEKNVSDIIDFAMKQEVQHETE